MLQLGESVEFSFWEAGCMIWLGSLPRVPSFCQAWFQLEDNVVKTDPDTIRTLILEETAIMPMGLYQDDGYYTRLVLRELNAREAEDWTARAAWQLNLPTGQVVISGVVDEDVETVAWADAELDGCLQVYVDVPPGQYAATVYAYPPGDLSTGWGQIADSRLFQPTPGIEPENPWDYFQRTRPGEPIPAWIGKDFAPTPAEREDYHQAYYSSNGHVNFVVQLLPLTTPVPTPEFEEDNLIKWEFRKPERCPLGIPIETPREII